MKQYSGEVDVVEVCTDDLADIAEQAGIVSIPTIQFYYKGEMKETIVGCVAKVWFLECFCSQSFFFPKLVLTLLSLFKECIGKCRCNHFG